MESSVKFFSELSELEYLKDALVALEPAYNRLIDDYRSRLVWMNVIILTAEDHKALNNRYLGHDYNTDVLTFGYSEDLAIEAEIYIDGTVLEKQAKDNNVGIVEEFSRLVLHGLLHLVGMNDESDEERMKMKTMEDRYLSLLNV